jgi:hypothetical protein
MNHTLLSVLAIGAAAVPFVFAALRVKNSGSDFRYLWVALASLLGAAAVMSVVRVSKAGPRGAFALSVAVFVVSTLAAALVARLQGTTVGPGMLVVVSAFGFCFAAGACFRALAHR